MTSIEYIGLHLLEFMKIGTFRIGVMWFGQINDLSFEIDKNSRQLECGKNHMKGMFGIV